MPHDHVALPDARTHRLLQFTVRRVDGDDVVDVLFERAPGYVVKLMFLGVSELKVSNFVPHDTGYAVLDVRDQRKPGRAVKLTPPRRGGLSLFARAVMAVDLD